MKKIALKIVRIFTIFDLASFLTIVLFVAIAFMGAGVVLKMMSEFGILPLFINPSITFLMFLVVYLPLLLLLTFFFIAVISIILGGWYDRQFARIYDVRLRVFRLAPRRVIQPLVDQKLQELAEEFLAVCESKDAHLIKQRKHLFWEAHNVAQALGFRMCRKVRDYVKKGKGVTSC